MFSKQEATVALQCNKREFRLKKLVSADSTECLCYLQNCTESMSMDHAEWFRDESMRMMTVVTSIASLLFTFMDLCSQTLYTPVLVHNASWNHYFSLRAHWDGSLAILSCSLSLNRTAALLTFPSIVTQIAEHEAWPAHIDCKQGPCNTTVSVHVTWQRKHRRHSWSSN
jgi:hypothetical protein